MGGGAGVNPDGEDPRQERDFMFRGSEQRTTEDSEDAEDSRPAGGVPIQWRLVVSHKPAGRGGLFAQRSLLWSLISRPQQVG